MLMSINVISDHQSQIRSFWRGKFNQKINQATF